MKAGTVHIKGPMTKEEKAAWDQLRERKQQCDLEIAELEDLLRKKRSGTTRQPIHDEIEHLKELRRMISKVIPD
jgi:hypothetical protein